MDLVDRDRRLSRAESILADLADRGVVAVATSFVDNAGISRVKSVPLDRLPALAAWGVGFSTAFDYFRFDDWVAAPPGGAAPVGDQRIVPDLDRLVVLAAQPGWAWAPGDRYDADRRAVRAGLAVAADAGSSTTWPAAASACCRRSRSSGSCRRTATSTCPRPRGRRTG